MAKAKNREPAGKIGIVVADQISSWTSCQSITRNLSKSYEGFLGADNIEFFNIKTDSSNAWSLAEKIYERDPKHLVFLDHKPHPADLLESIAAVYGSRPLPQFTFHLFGDFTLYPKEWVRLDPVLRKAPTKFICSSDRQANLVATLLDHNMEHPEVCHFPVDGSVFNFDNDLRKEVRAELAVSDDEFVIVYTGRLSLQKNIFRLLRDLNSLWVETQLPIRIFFAGPYDDLGAPLFGLNFSEGSYFNQISNLLDGFSSGLKERFQYLGNLNAQELRRLYNAADIFTSLSLHHDEDYGMSPAEALCCGLPAVLSDWGGYASFKRDEKSCFLVPVRLGPRTPRLALEHFSKGVLAQLVRNETCQEKQVRSAFYRDELSIEAASRRLQEIHRRPAKRYKGFNDLMVTYARHFKYINLYNREPVQTKLYKEIYVNYTSKSTKTNPRQIKTRYKYKFRQADR